MVILLVMLVMVTTVAGSVHAETTSKGKAVFYIGREGYSLNGSWQEADIAPYIQPLPDGLGRTMMPVRFVSLAVGADDVHWDGASNMVTVIKGRDVLRLYIDAKPLFVNNETFMMDVPAVLQPVPGGGRTMIPVAHLADALGVTYEWNNQDRSVTFWLD